MKLKGYTVAGNFIDVEISDCPIYLTESLLALSAKNNSELVKANSLVRYDEETEYCEGDIIVENDVEIGYVIYAAGFKMYQNSGEIKNIPTGEHIYLSKGTEASIAIIAKCPQRTALVFGYRGKEIAFKSFVCPVGKHIATAEDNFAGKRIDGKQVTFYTGYVTGDDELICFDDFRQGGKVSLYKGLPVIVTVSGKIEKLNGKVEERNEKSIKRSSN